MTLKTCVRYATTATLRYIPRWDEAERKRPDDETPNRWPGWLKNSLVADRGGTFFKRHPGFMKPRPNLCFCVSDFFNLSKYRKFNIYGETS